MERQRGKERKEEDKVTSLRTACMYLYIQDTKEEEEDKVGIGSVSERGNGEGVVKGNGGGR